MSKAEHTLPDFLSIYRQYQELKPGPKAELRRAATPSDLTEIPAFYRFLAGTKAGPAMQRLIYCLPYLTHQDNGKSLGQALASAAISEKRLFMVIRSNEPNDLVQLRRLIQQAKPVVHWPTVAKAIYYWNDLAKRTVLEDFFFYHHSNSSNTSVQS